MEKETVEVERKILVRCFLLLTMLAPTEKHGQHVEDLFWSAYKPLRKILKETDEQDEKIR